MANTVVIAGKRSERSSRIAHCKAYSIELIAPPEFVLPLSIRTSQSDQPNRSSEESNRAAAIASVVVFKHIDLAERYIESVEQGLYHWKYD